MESETEHEFKYLLNQNDFENVINNLKKQYPNVPCKEKTQINFYYDAHNGLFQSQGITCRVRQTGSKLIGQIKHHGTDSLYTSQEINFKVESLPDRIQYGQESLCLQGCLVTRRYSFQVNDFLKVECDVNMYLGKQDFEVELEYQNGCDDIAQAVASELGLFEINTVSKSERFFRQKAGLESMHYIID